jgi:hypothetical protein
LIKATLIKARKITDQILQVQTDLENFFGLFRGFATFFIQRLETMDKDGKDRGNCLGCTKESPIQSCATLLNDKSYKTSGYYYLQTICMPVVQRVWCDMNASKGNFYLYSGNLQAA